MQLQSLIDSLASLSEVEVEDDNRVSYQGLSFFLDIPQGRKLLIVAQAKPGYRILLSPESDYTRRADELGVSDETKIGRSEFDTRYVIRDEEKKADAMLTEDVISLITELEPFVELELTRREYRLLKDPPDDAALVLADLGRMARLIDQTRAGE